MSITRDIKEIKEKVKKENKLAENIGKTLEKALVMGIDLSKMCPGVCVLNKTNDSIVFVDSFKMNSGTSNKDRNLEILYWILSIVDKYRPSSAIIESPFISTFTIKSAGPLMKLHGILDHFLFENGLEIYEITPSSSRSFLGIKPNTKEKAFSFIKEKFPELELKTFSKDNDKSDSVILALNYTNKKLKQIT